MVQKIKNKMENKMKKQMWLVELITKAGNKMTMEILAKDQFDAVHECIASLSDEITFDGEINVYDTKVPYTQIIFKTTRVYHAKLKF